MENFLNSNVASNYASRHYVLIYLFISRQWVRKMLCNQARSPMVYFLSTGLLRNGENCANNSTRALALPGGLRIVPQLHPTSPAYYCAKMLMKMIVLRLLRVLPLPWLTILVRWASTMLRCSHAMVLVKMSRP